MAVDESASASLLPIGRSAETRQLNGGPAVDAGAISYRRSGR
jgi:hypothetical protein